MAAEWGTEMAQSSPPAQARPAGREPLSSCPPGAEPSPRGMAAGTATPAPRGCFSLQSIPGLKWMNTFCLTPPCESKGHQPDPQHLFASALTCIAGHLLVQSSAARFLGLQ